MYKFRAPYASELEIRVSQINSYYTNLLLYKDARCDQNILDEVVGPMNWQKKYSRDNANCTVSIWDPDKNQWISKEDTGTESNTEKEKGLASDSFKRACTNWGIGRELYSSPRIAFPTASLHNVKQENGRWKCYDRFSVSDITYTEGGLIKTVTIEVSDNSGVYLTQTFGSLRAVRSENEAIARTAEPVPMAAATAQTKAVPQAEATQPAVTPAPASEPKKQGIKAPIDDSEVILIGNSKGKTFGEVKNTQQFLSFLKMTASSTDAGYQTEEEQRQFAVFKKLGQQIYGGVA